MISIRKYLDGNAEESEPERGQRRAISSRPRGQDNDALRASLKAFGSALGEMGRASVDACPAEGTSLDSRLGEIVSALGDTPSSEAIARADAGMQTAVRDWGRRAAGYYRAKAGEVKELLLAMARTTESVGERDERCARHIEEVTRNLRGIANLDDLSEIRISIERSAARLTESFERITEEGRAVLERMQSQVTTFQAKLEQAEQLASIDALTRLRSRVWVEGQLEQRLAGGAPFCVALLDIDGFKGVNDTHGHAAGDALLKQFAEELKSACRSSDIVGRWGGDEFLIVLDGELAQAEAQLERVRKWVCGQYTVQTVSAVVKLNVEASIGLAEWAAPEGLSQVLERADAAMYERKGPRRLQRGAGS